MKKAEPTDKTFTGFRDQGILGKDVLHGRAFDVRVGRFCDEFENFISRCMIVQDVKCYGTVGISMDDYRIAKAEHGFFKAYIEVPDEYAADMRDVIFSIGRNIVPDITWEEDRFPRVCADMKGHEVKNPNHTVFGWLYEYMPSNEVHFASEVRADIKFLLTCLEYKISLGIHSKEE